MTCIGKPAMEFGKPDKPSAYADEGTAAHFLGSESLTFDTHPSTWIGRKILVGTSFVAEFDGAVWADREDAPADWRTRGTYEVDLEMIASVNTYVQGVKRMAPGVKLEVETRIPIESITGEKDAAGTADCIALVPFDDETGFGVELQVHDLKYGKGNPVSAQQNSQLRIYGGAWRISNPSTPVDRVRCVIHQPRKFNDPDQWVESAEENDAFIADARNKATAATLALTHRVNWIGKDDTYLSPSDEACQYCRAKAECPALDAKVENAVGTDLEHFADLTQVEIESSVDSCPDERLGLKLACCDLLEKWIAAVRGEVESRLFAAGNSEAAREALGYKLVGGKKGARIWLDAAKAEDMLKSMRLKQEEMYDFKVISPTSAEKIFGEKGSAPSVKRWNKLQELITQKDGSPHVAPLLDKRPALVIDKAAGFDDETGGDLV